MRSTPTGAEPLIKANAQKLKPGWYQLNIAVANRAPYGLVVDELRRVRPKSARLMSPIQSVSTRQGDFQVWSDPTTDKAKTSMPLDIAIAAHEQHQGGVRPASEAQIIVWLFLPECGCSCLTAATRPSLNSSWLYSMGATIYTPIASASCAKSVR